jgi:hypothetical protein
MFTPPAIAAAMVNTTTPALPATATDAPAASLSPSWPTDIAYTNTNNGAVANAAAIATAAALPPLPPISTSPCCDWAVEKCHMIGLAPIKCQRSGCKKYVHHLCSIQWVALMNLPEEGIETLCRAHHPQYSSITTSRMTVSTVNKTQREKLPVSSKANKITASTTVKTRVNKSGELVAAVKTKEPRIKSGVRVYSTKNQLKSFVKQGDPLYDTIQNVGNSF